MNPAFEIQLIAVIVAVSCALPGVFLVLRKNSMISDSITHTVLLGIVLSFFITKDMSSPALIIGAALVGAITVWLTDTIVKTRLVVEDSAIGIVFPLLFSIAVILITRFAGNVHIDTDTVLLGELAFVPFERLAFNGTDIGARMIYSSGALLLINIALITVFFKELKLTTFDPLLAAVLGFSPVVIHYGLMTLVSITAVGAFEAVGSILVVAFMVGPPVTAYLLTDDLRTMLFFSACFAMLSAVFGFRLAIWLDVSISGSIAVMIGLLFTITLFVAPKRGLISVIYKKSIKHREFMNNTLLLHICKYPDSSISDVRIHLCWDEKTTLSIVNRLLHIEKIILHSGLLTATQYGIDDADRFLRSLSDGNC